MPQKNKLEDRKVGAELRETEKYPPIRIRGKRGGNLFKLGLDPEADIEVESDRIHSGAKPACSCPWHDQWGLA